MRPSSTLLWSPELYALGEFPIWALWVLLLWQADYCGQSWRCVWLLFLLVARPCLVWRLPAIGGWGWFKMWLAVDPWGVPVLVLAHWWVELCPGVAGCEYGSQI